ncbi:M14-type cytosolic carboxypeptidase [Rhabdobacter roseus]
MVSRRQFLAEASVRTLGTSLLAASGGSAYARVLSDARAKSIKVRQDFPGGGGVMERIDEVRRAIRFRAHNEQGGGWGQVWWYFQVDGLTPGTLITLELNYGHPPGSGVAPQAYFSTDQKTWQLTAAGQEAADGPTQLMVYNQRVLSARMWFAYNLPYLPEHLHELRTLAEKSGTAASVYDLCRSRNHRPVLALRLAETPRAGTQRYGIWLQARAHAFESGTSWVLHELARWLMSSDPEARQLRACADLTLVPIVDVDGVVEGRTGKNQPPYDHNRGWDESASHWPEVRAIQAQLTELTRQNALDLFIDIHGPGNGAHPYFICPTPSALPTDLRRQNQAAFLACLEAQEQTKETRKALSMERFFFSPRQINYQSSAGWVSAHTTPSVVALTLETNMSSPLSTPEGYQAEGRALGRGIARYFTGNRHLR